MRALLVTMVALTIAGCSKQQEVKSRLVRAGVAAPMADCMSAEMSKRLSVAQLKKLSRANTGDGKPLNQLTTGDYIDRAQRVGDPEVLAVAGLAAAYCSGAR